MKFKISWSGSIGGVPAGGRQIVKDWEDVSFHLNRLKSSAGTVSLQLLNGPDPGPIRISLIADRKIYLVTMLEATEDGTDVRAYFDPAVTPEMVDVLGDMWDSRQLTGDFDFVCLAFKTFFERGDVSRQWLS